MHRGYIKIWRKIKDSGLYQMPETFALFMHLLTEATHQPRRVGAVKLERGQYVAGRIQLAAELQQTERKIRTGIERLQELEIISVETTNRYSIYTIVNYNIYQDSDQQATSERPASDQQATSERPASDQQATTKQTHKHKEQNTEGIKKKPVADYSPEFECFWQAYPYKTGKDKAFESWLKRNPNLQEVLNSLAWQSLSDNWTKENGKFIPMPSTYLNQGRWKDEPLKLKAHPQTRQTENDRVREAARKILFGANEEKAIESI